MFKVAKNLLASILAATLLFAVPTAVQAQNDPRDKIIDSLELDQADVREALKILFKEVNVNFTVDSNVTGTVTVSLKKVPFETALRNILNQVSATYKVEAGIYVIRLRETQVDNAGSGGTETLNNVKRDKPPVRIQLRYADPALIAMLITSDQPNFQLQPEWSTIVGGMGGGSGMGGGMGGGGFGGMGGGGFGGGMGGGGFGGGLGGGGFGGGGLGGGGFGGGSFGGGGMGRGGGIGR